jgi:hypothetical protein
VADSVQGVLLRNADAAGNLPVARETVILQATGASLQRMFLGVDGLSAFGQDGVTALAPFPYLLNYWSVYAIVAHVKAHQAWMQKSIPEDVYDWLASVPSRPVPIKGASSVAETIGGRGIARSPRTVTSVAEQENPFLRREGESDETFRQRLDDLRIFQPNPLAEYESMHTWVDPGGYVLSKRIWDNADDAREKLDEMLRDAIREGISAEQLAKQAEQWLLPGLLGWRTKKPYGRDGSYPAMRLARTEIAQAANNAAYMSAMLNPYVGGVDVARSRNGDPLCKVCPEHATIDLNQERVKDPYPMGAGEMPVYHPHCMCRILPVVADDPATVTAQLRAVMADARNAYLVPYLTPVQAETFIDQLIGEALRDMLAQVLQLPLF